MQLGSSCPQLQLLPGSQAQAAVSPAMLQAKRGFMRFRLICLTLGTPEWKEEREAMLNTSWQQKMLEIPRCLQLSHFPKNDPTHVSGDFFGALRCSKFRHTAALSNLETDCNTRSYDLLLSNGRLVLQQNLHRRRDAFTFHWSCQELSTNHDFLALD